MSITLSELVERLMSDAPARDGIPDAMQYERCVKAAVDDLGRRAGRYKIATLSIVSGTASYALPGDFVRMIRLESLIFPDDVMHTAAGLVPLPQGYSEKVTVANGQVTFYPTPSYSTTRYLHYQAGWALALDVTTGEMSYAELAEAEAQVLLLHAAGGAIGLQANYYAQQAWQYQIGDERVSKEKLASELRAQAVHLLERYKAAVSSGLNGPYGSRADYPVEAYS